MLSLPTESKVVEPKWKDPFGEGEEDDLRILGIRVWEVMMMVELVERVVQKRWCHVTKEIGANQSLSKRIISTIIFVSLSCIYDCIFIRSRNGLTVLAEVVSKVKWHVRDWLHALLQWNGAFARMAAWRIGGF